jgi:AcrR family transcriptional regulator
MAATRTRIIGAAAELFRTQGASHTTVAQIAALADVAPGTVRNHFGTTEELAEAVATQVMAELRMPGPEIFAGHRAVAARVGALAIAMAAYYERSQPWYRMDQLDERPVAAWAAARARYEADFDALVRGAVGPDADDETVAVVASFVSPSVLATLAARGMTMDEAGGLVGRVIGPWLETRAAPRPRRVRR